MKRIFLLIFIIIEIIAFSSCERNKEEICVDEYKIIYAEYSMHVGATKGIKHDSILKINDKKVDMMFDHVEGDNLESFNFFVDNIYDNTFYITCIKDIVTEAHINKIVYTTEGDEKKYYLNADILIKKEETYNPFEPFFLDIDVDISSKYGFYDHLGDEVIIKLTNGTLGDRTSKGEEPYQKIVNKISVSTNLVKIKAIKYEICEDFTGWNSENLMDDFLDFTNNTIFVMIFFEKAPGFDNGLIYFDLIFDVTYNGENYTITRNMYTM